MKIALDRIVAGLTSRQKPGPHDADVALATSIDAIGLLQPIMVRPAGNTALEWTAATSADGTNQMLEVVNGARRVKAARLLGWTEIEATVRNLSDAEVYQMQLADNGLHQALHPVETWLSVQRMLEAGMDERGAAVALGLNQRELGQIRMLGRLAPGFLDLCRIDMPHPTHLRRIALASREKQEAVAAEEWLDPDDGVPGPGDIPWDDIAFACEERRACRAWAAFDPVTADIAWQEDLFAEPGADDQWTTDDLPRFKQLQREALTAQANADKRTVFLEVIPTTGSVSFPPGFRRDWAATKRERGMMTALVLTHSGQVETWFLRQHQSAAPIPAADDSREEEDPRVNTAGGADHASEQPDKDAAEPEPTDAIGVNKVGLAIVAARKTEAARTAIAAAALDPSDLVLMLVLMLCGDNVRIAGLGSLWRDRIAARLITPEGTLREGLEDGEIASAAKDILFEAIRFRASHETFGDQSGPAGEWLARLWGAEGFLPRFDDEAFLATCTGETLKKAAAHGQVKWSGTVKAMRQRLEGQAEGWAPDAAQFGAPGPRV